MRVSKYLILLITFSAALSFAQGRSSGGGGSGVVRKVEKKVQSRWSLAEWMDQKKNMKWQDQWLAINTSDNPFEFFLEGESADMSHYPSLDKNDKTRFQRVRGRAGAYATIVGIEGGYEMEHKNWGAWDASFNLRLFGTAQQNTNITLQGGLKGYTYLDKDAPQTNERFQNTFAGVGTCLYFTKYFGVEGSYRKIFPQKSDKQTELSGENSRAILFIDFSFVRVYGGWNKEHLIFKNTQGFNPENRDGYMGGIRLWF